MSTTSPETRPVSVNPADIPHPPNVTISSGPEYAKRLIEHVARSFLTSPIVISLIAEADDIKQGSFNTFTYERRIKHFESGPILPLAEEGALIAEADNWTAASLWEPPGFKRSILIPRNQNPRPVLKEYLATSSAVRAKYLGSQYQEKHWHLSYLARDPSKTGKGAVSAVMRPFLEKAKEDRVPAWLESVDLHAVRVYEHYGFRVCEKMIIGQGIARADGWPEEDGEGFAVWAMVYDKHLKA